MDKAEAIIKTENTNKAAGHEHSQYQKYEFLINGSKVYAVFPKHPDNKTMSIIKNILLDSHMKKAEKPHEILESTHNHFDRKSFV